MKRSSKGEGLVKRSWRRLWRPLGRLSLGAMLLIAMGFGAVSLGAVNGAIKATNTQDFCLSCHEMRTTVYEEYKNTVHYHNNAGVRATCSDCHVPREGFAKILRKVMAVRDVYHHLAGTIDTPEKFEAHRAAMAQRVWDYMKASDSRECRSCHDSAAMVLANQKPRAAAQHQDMLASGETCVDCHKGIAHKMPATAASPAPQTGDFTLN
jgi:nitrate/TMAO reductase-like tetraheme cytochrome c subunit